MTALSLFYWFHKIWSPSSNGSPDPFNDAATLNETSLRKAYLLNSVHNTMISIGFSFALWSLITNSLVVTFPMLLVAALVMAVFNQVPYAIGEYNLRQTMLRPLREELNALALSTAKNTRNPMRRRRASERVKEIMTRHDQITRDHPLFVKWGILLVGPLGWSISEIIKQMAS
jgi:hypothetical protein